MTAKLAADEGAALVSEPEISEWEAFKAKLILQPDGTYLNPNGIEDERFFELLESLRSERLMQPFRDPFEGFEAAPLPNPTQAKPVASRKRAPRR